MDTIADIFRRYGVLDARGRHVNGTDKETNHRYGAAYERIFTYESAMDDPTPVVQMQYPYSFRKDVRLMMEVGVADGSSLLAWREVFPNALCVGLDIMPNPVQLLHDKARVEFHVGNACQRADCQRAVAGRLFDVIVEDAAHRISETLLTLYWLWPHVRPNGLYVVEEWDGAGGDADRIRALFPQAQIVDTQGPFGGNEPLVVLRKPALDPYEQVAE